MNALRSLCFLLLNLFLYVAYCRQVKIFRRRVGYFPNIALPRKFHEKMLWRKIFDRNPLFTIFCDKLATKEYIRKHAPELTIPRTLWVGRDLRQAPRELFDADVVVKANHGSGFNAFSRADGFDLAQVCALADQWMQTTYGREDMEWGYRDVKKTLFVEERIMAPDSDHVTDLLIRCADGQAICVNAVLAHKTDQQQIGAFHTDGSPLVFDNNPDIHAYGQLPADFSLPGTFFQAVALAEKLSQGVDYARFDFMTDGSALYASEITVYPMAGLARATPHGLLGQETVENPFWDLKKSWFFSTPQPGWKRHYAKALAQMLADDNGDR